MSNTKAEKGVLLAFPSGRSRASSAPANRRDADDSALEASPLQSSPTLHSDHSETACDSSATDAAEYDEVFDRLSERIQAGDAIAANERINAPIRYAELLSHPVADRLELIEKNPRFHSYLLAEMLLERCREAELDELSQAIDAARMAISIAQRLNESFYGRELRRGLEIKSWAVLGNCWRHQGNLVTAEEAFQRVDLLLDEVLVESPERSEALSLKVSLLNDQNRFEEAKVILDELARVYKRTGDSHKLGRTLLQYAIVQGEVGDLDGAIESQLASLGLLRACGDDRLCSLALANLARFLEDAGRSEEALRFLDQAGELIKKTGSQGNIARLRWLEGRIAASLDQDERAEQAFNFARKFFSDRAIDVEAATACLDLALLYARGGRTAELKGLAAEMVPVFQRQGLDREILAALLLFQHAAEKEIATLGLLEEIASYLKRTQEHSKASKPS